MVKISTPEILIASSCVLFCVGQTATAVAFVSLGILGALFRIVIENSLRIEQFKREKQSREEVRETINAVGDALSKFTATISQRNYDSDFN